MNPRRPWRIGCLCLPLCAIAPAYDLVPVTCGVQYDRLAGPGAMCEIGWNPGSRIDTGTWKYRWHLGPTARLDIGPYGMDAGLGFVVGNWTKFGPFNYTPYALWGTSFGTGGIDQETRNRWGGRLHARAIFFDIGLGFFYHGGVDAVIGLDLPL